MDKESAIKLLSIAKYVVGKSVELDDGRKLEIGDLVEDKKNDEYGFFLGVKPRTISIKDDNSNNSKSLLSDVLVLLTFVEADNGELSWRIHYTNYNKVDLLKKESLKKDLDINRFCENQCIMYCSKECALWKHSKNNKPSENT